MDSNTLNIVVAGKSGVGKSSFLNYLLGEEVFQTGIGDPVTQSYFDKKEMPANDQGVKYVLYDTKGIEPTTAIECKDKIIKEIEKRDNYVDFFKWIHSVYYCFDSTAARIEPFEIGFIKELEKKASVIVLLTKSDKTDSARLNSLKEELHKTISPSILVIPVCSIESNGTRKNPQKVFRFGKEEVLRSSFYGLWNKISGVIPNKNVAKVLEAVEELKPETMRHSPGKTYEEIDRFDRKYPGFKDANVERLNRIQDLLRKTSVNPSRQVYDKVIDFYKKVNRFTPQMFFLTESQNVFNELKNYDPSADFDSIRNALINVRGALYALSSCWFWDEAERNMLRKEMEHYSETINTIKRRLQNKIEKYVDVFKGELLQYGRLCISEEKVVNEDFDTTNDLNKDEYLYARIVDYALKTGHDISPDERYLLDKLRMELKISEFKAGRIEDHLRNL